MDKLLKEIKKLTRREQLKIAHQIINDLEFDSSEESISDSPKISKAWIAEAELRLVNYDKGIEKSLTLEESRKQIKDKFNL